jgi:hypothetical protein
VHVVEGRPLPPSLAGIVGNAPTRRLVFFNRRPLIFPVLGEEASASLQRLRRFRQLVFHSSLVERPRLRVRARRFRAAIALAARPTRLDPSKMDDGNELELPLPSRNGSAVVLITLGEPEGSAAGAENRALLSAGN